MKQTLRRILAVSGKEWIQIIRDTRSLILSLIAPSLLILLFGYALTMDVKNVRIAILDNDKTSQSRKCMEPFLHTDYFIFDSYLQSYKEIDSLFDKKQITAALVFSPGFGRAIERGSSTAVQVIIDGSDSTSANVSLGYINAIVTAFSLDIAKERALTRGIRFNGFPVTTEERIWYNETLVTRNYILPGLIALILAIICALIASLTISREFERGTFETLLSTPLRPYEIVFGKMIPYILIGVFDTVSALLMSHFFFDLPFRGNFAALIAVSLLFLAGMTGMGILISAITRIQVLSVQFAMVLTYLPTFILSGFLFPIPNMPAFIQGVTYFIPAKYLITVIKGIAIKGVGASALYSQILFLTAFCFVVGLITIMKVRSFIPYRNSPHD